jgi:ferredoxin
VLETTVQKSCGERKVIGVFAESFYNYVEQLVESCPEKALIIERIEKE